MQQSPFVVVDQVVKVSSCHSHWFVGAVVIFVIASIRCRRVLKCGLASNLLPFWRLKRELRRECGCRMLGFYCRVSAFWFLVWVLGASQCFLTFDFFLAFGLMFSLWGFLYVYMYTFSCILFLLLTFRVRCCAIQSFAAPRIFHFPCAMSYDGSTAEDTVTVTVRRHPNSQLFNFISITYPRHFPCFFLFLAHKTSPLKSPAAHEITAVIIPLSLLVTPPPVLPLQAESAVRIGKPTDVDELIARIAQRLK